MSKNVLDTKCSLKSVFYTEMELKRKKWNFPEKIWNENLNKLKQTEI